MAAGRPVLYIGPRNATPARIIERFGCGWHIEPGDSTALIGLLSQLAKDPSLVREAGHRGRRAFLEHFDLPIGITRICSALNIPLGTQLPQSARGSYEQRAGVTAAS
jgi:glycosyltransferase involved in cell wall biosynthesis